MLDSLRYQHLFFDLDHTLWDFESNARATLAQLYEELSLEQLGIVDFDRFYRRYLEHNEKLWDRYRKGFIKQEELRIKRMRLALLDFGVVNEPIAAAMNVRFLDLLPTRTILFPHTREVLDYLRQKGYTLHLITNGFEKTQHSKLHYSGLASYFSAVITSEGSGSLKPKPEIFMYALQQAGTTPEHSIMIGDTIEVDIEGAKNAGIDQIHVNHLGPEKIALSDGSYPTHTVFSLQEMMKIL
ncbi:MAG: YjjG family noncanonical pyrimidine nucleotidase [Sphingomonadales bacterium]